jgi:hypothetical protein
MFHNETSVSYLNNLTFNLNLRGVKMENPEKSIVPEKQVINRNFTSYLIDNYEKVISCKISSGVITSRISVLNKGSEIDKKDAEKLTKDFTFKVKWNFKLASIDTILNVCTSAQSPIVALQAEIRKLGDERIKKLVKGEETKFDDDRYTIKNGLIEVDFERFITAKAVREKLTEEQKLCMQLRKVNSVFADKTDDEILEIVKLMK